MVSKNTEVGHPWTARSDYISSFDTLVGGGRVYNLNLKALICKLYQLQAIAVVCQWNAGSWFILNLIIDPPCPLRRALSQRNQCKYFRPTTLEGPIPHHQLGCGAATSMFLNVKIICEH